MSTRNTKNTARPASQKGQNKTQEELSQTSKGMISKPTKIVSDISKMLTSVPYIGGAASIASPVFGTVSSIAETLGYNKPVNLAATEQRKLRVTDPFAHGIGLDTIPRLALDPEASVLSQNIDLDPVDYNQFDNYKLLPALVDVFTQQYTDTVGTELIHFPVSPMYCATVSTTSTAFHLNHLNNLASRHVYWRGSMKYALYAFAQPFVSTRIRITWFPLESFADPNVNTYAGNYYSEIHDIQGSTLIKFSVPYMSETKYKFSGDLVRAQFHSVSSDAHFKNGIIKINVVNSIAGSEGTEKVSYSLFQSAGEDMMFFQPRPFCLPPDTMPTPTSEFEEAKGESETYDLRHMFRETFKPIHPATTHFEKHVNFGDLSTDWRTYWHRYSSFSTQENHNADVDSVKEADPSTWYQILLDVSFRQRSFTIPYKARAPLSDEITKYFNNFFHFRRGSVRYVAELDQELANGGSLFNYKMRRARFKMLPPLASDAKLLPQSSMSSSLWGVVHNDASSRQAVEAEVPYMSNANLICTSLFFTDQLFDQLVAFEFQKLDPATFNNNTNMFHRNALPINFSVGDDYSWFCPRDPAIVLYVGHSAGFTDVEEAKGEEDDGNPLSGLEISETEATQELTSVSDVAPTDDVSGEIIPRSKLWLPASYEKAEISEILSRMYTYPFLMNSAQAMGTTIFSMSFPEHLISTQPFIREKIKNFMYIRGRFQVEIRANTTKMHAGSLLVSWLPHYNGRALPSMETGGSFVGKNAFSSIWASSNNPCAVYDITSNNPLVIDIPSTAPLEFLDVPLAMDPSTNGWFGVINCKVLTPLNLLDGSAASIELTVSVRMLDAELYGPTYAT